MPASPSVFQNVPASGSRESRANLATAACSFSSSRWKAAMSPGASLRPRTAPSAIRRASSESEGATASQTAQRFLSSSFA
ncbi:MAG: hypothetical protein BWX69_03275 [Planctomycetes bacterium ADurb.Bin069]|nr:MAG: hypothetical protein BWX69_03275 [Planctomycetes bacterium ADurb.Bin069]